MSACLAQLYFYKNKGNNYTLFQENIILPVKTYIPGFGWGSMYADIAE